MIDQLQHGGLGTTLENPIIAACPVPDAKDVPASTRLADAKKGALRAPFFIAAGPLSAAARQRDAA
ncbi:hypothetical protein GCM10007350_18060 [Jeongeupia chitinilytica]|uniref:Uncharacterized protein n=1 Tax=Jeongeupia chitinilytica TaxID=1041641 RepID=A0ABQ3H1Z9_9NEIS|nr:hypothetical protein GCM10007350_18060 [Jeongeupia chitinilytica]